MQFDLSILVNFLASWTFEGITFGVFLLVFVWLLARLHNSNSSAFLIDGLLVDDRGKSSVSKLGELVALIVSTWVVVHMSIGNELTFDIFTAYLAVWAANRGLRHFINSKYSSKNEPSDQSRPYDQSDSNG
jgi:hypothetical protein